MWLIYTNEYDGISLLFAGEYFETIEEAKEALIHYFSMRNCMVDIIQDDNNAWRWKVTYAKQSNWARIIDYYNFMKLEKHKSA